MKKIILLLIIGFLISASGFYIYSKRTKESPYIFAKVERRTITQMVSASGTVSAKPKIDLQFPLVGQIENISVNEGDIVSKDQILAELDNQNYAQQIKVAEILISFNQARLDQELAGVKKEKISIAETELERTKRDLNNSTKTLEDIKIIHQEQIQQAQIQINTAELAVDKAKDNLTFVQNKKTDDQKNAEIRLKNAETALQNSQTNLQDTKITAELAIDTAYTNIATAFANSISSINNQLIAIDSILGVDNPSIVNKNQIQLGSKDLPSMLIAEESYKKAKYSYETSQIIHDNWRVSKQRNEVAEIKDQIESALQNTEQALNDTITVLENSTSTEANISPTNQLKSLKEMMLSQKLDNTKVQNSLTSSFESIKNAENSKITSINSAEALIDSRRADLDNGKAALSNIDITSSNSVTTAEFAVEESLRILDESKQKLNELTANIDKQQNDLIAVIKLKESAVSTATAQIMDLKSPPRSVDIRSLKANIDKSRTDLEIAKYNYDQTILKAPIDGQIVAINKEIGESITPQEIFISINTKELVVKSNISETDISKVKIGNTVAMTFDAFDFTDELQGSIATIAPAETIIDGVIYYEVTSNIANNEQYLIKSGMTVNLKIKTNEIENALSIPLRAIKYKEDKRYVQILKNTELFDQEIQTGLEGGEHVEVVKGLEEGEGIVTFVKAE